MQTAKYKILNTKYIFILVLFIVALLERTVFDLGPNVELVTMAMILASVYLGSRYSFWLTLFIMVVSDFILGNSNIFLFTWTGFLIPAVIIGNIFSKHKVIKSKRIALGTVSGMGSTLFFFLWTNFGVWLLGTMYPKSPGGLLMSYIMGLPFLRNQELSTLLFVPLGLVITETYLLLAKNKLTFLNKNSA